MNGGQ
jgi:hypothetical protein